MEDMETLHVHIHMETCRDSMFTSTETWRHSLSVSTWRHWDTPCPYPHGDTYGDTPCLYPHGDTYGETHDIETLHVHTHRHGDMETLCVWI